MYFFPFVAVEAIRKIDIIRQRRANHFVMQRLRKARELEIQHDVREVQRDMSLIRSPAAGLRERRAQEEGIVEEIHESDEEMELENDSLAEESDLEEAMESDEAPELVEVS